MLTFLGTQPATPVYTLMAQIGMAIYFAFFLLMPWYTARERTKPVPERVTEKPSLLAKALQGKSEQGESQ